MLAPLPNGRGSERLHDPTLTEKIKSPTIRPIGHPRPGKLVHTGKDEVNAKDREAG